MKKVTKELNIKCTIFGMKTYPIELNSKPKETDKIIGEKVLEILDFRK